MSAMRLASPLFWGTALITAAVIYFHRVDDYNQICREGLNKALALKGELSDKHLYKLWIRRHLPKYEPMLPKTLFRTKRLDELGAYIGSGRSPRSFIIKNTHGSGMNIIVEDKDTMNYREVISKAHSFLKTNFRNSGKGDTAHRRKMQLHYDYNEPSLIVEEFLGKNLKDLKYHIIDGRLVFHQVIHKGGETMLYPNTADKQLEGIAVDIYKEINRASKEPIRLVRVDFLETQGREIYLGEVTFSPGACNKVRPPL